MIKVISLEMSKERQAHHGKICFSEKCVEDLPDG